MKRINNHLALSILALTTIIIISLGCVKEEEPEYDLDCVEGMDVEEFYFYGNMGNNSSSYYSGNTEISTEMISYITFNNDRTFTVDLLIPCDPDNPIPICEQGHYADGKYEIQIKGTWDFTQTITKSRYGGAFSGYGWMKGFDGEVLLNVTESPFENQIGSVVIGGFSINCVENSHRDYFLSFHDFPLKDSERISMNFHEKRSF